MSDGGDKGYNKVWPRCYTRCPEPNQRVKEVSTGGLSQADGAPGGNFIASGFLKSQEGMECEPAGVSFFLAITSAVLSLLLWATSWADSILSDHSRL